VIDLSGLIQSSSRVTKKWMKKVVDELKREKNRMQRRILTMVAVAVSALVSIPGTADVYGPDEVQLVIEPKACQPGGYQSYLISWDYLPGPRGPFQAVEFYLMYRLPNSIEWRPFSCPTCPSRWFSPPDRPHAISPGTSCTFDVLPDRYYRMQIHAIAAPTFPPPSGTQSEVTPISGQVRAGSRQCN
jgi:hypothetical protein